MKKIILLSLSALFLLSFSCEKCNKPDQKEQTYYSKDFKDSNAEFLGVSSSDLDQLYFTFFTENKSERFKFIGMENGEYVYHEGNYVKSGQGIQFYPEDSSHPSYEGTFSVDGKTLTISYPGADENRTEVTFILKEEKKECGNWCGFGK